MDEDLREEPESHQHGPECRQPVTTRAELLEALDRGVSMYFGDHGFHMVRAQITYRGVERDVLVIHDREHVVRALAPNVERAHHLMSLLDTEIEGTALMNAMLQDLAVSLEEEMATPDTGDLHERQN